MHAHTHIHTRINTATSRAGMASVYTVHMVGVVLDRRLNTNGMYILLSGMHDQSKCKHSFVYFSHRLLILSLKLHYCKAACG